MSLLLGNFGNTAVMDQLYMKCKTINDKENILLLSFKRLVTGCTRLTTHLAISQPEKFFLQMSETNDDLSILFSKESFCDRLT